MRAELVIPVLMGCALIWWIGRALSWSARLAVTAVTLLAIIAILAAERFLN